MTKQIEIHGQRVRLFSSDKGRTWTSSPRPTAEYSQGTMMLRLELQKSFARIAPQDYQNTRTGRGASDRGKTNGRERV